MAGHYPKYPEPDNHEAEGEDQDDPLHHRTSSSSSDTNINAEKDKDIIEESESSYASTATIIEPEEVDKNEVLKPYHSNSSSGHSR